MVARSGRIMIRLIMKRKIRKEISWTTRVSLILMSAMLLIICIGQTIHFRYDHAIKSLKGFYVGRRDRVGYKQAIGLGLFVRRLYWGLNHK